MKASRTDDSRRVDWSGVKDGPVKLIGQVTRYVGGIRGPRKEGVTTKQILTWFHGTPEGVVQDAIGNACAQGKIRCCMRSLGSNQRSNGGYIYVVDEASQDTEDHNGHS